MGGKRYWWLKLPEDFFRQLPMKKLRRIAGGDTYTIIYLKMMLLSLKTEGILSYECEEDDFIENLALDIDEDEENVAVAVAFLTKYKLLENGDDEATKILPSALDAIGCESASAKRMRDLRRRKKEKSVTLLPPCDDNVTGALRRDRYRDREDIEIEKEIDNTHADTYISQQNAMFEKFWEEYPRKVGKAEARIAWAGLEVDEKLNQTILNAVQRYKKTNQWQNTTYIPYPVNFLQNERYNDDIPEDNDSVETLEDIAKRLYGSGDE